MPSGWFRVRVRALPLDVNVHLMNLTIHLGQAYLIHFDLYPSCLGVNVRVWVDRLLHLYTLGGRPRTQIALQRLGFFMNWHYEVLGQGIEERRGESTHCLKPRNVIAHGFSIVGGYSGTDNWAKWMRLRLEFLLIVTWVVLWLLTWLVDGELAAINRRSWKGWWSLGSYLSVLSVCWQLAHAASSIERARIARNPIKGLIRVDPYAIWYLLNPQEEFSLGLSDFRQRHD